MFEPEPETMESIKGQGRHLFAAGDVWRCGCERRLDRFFMCSFHEGFEAGLECARTVPPTPPETVETPCDMCHGTKVGPNLKLCAICNGTGRKPENVETSND